MSPPAEALCSPTKHKLFVGAHKGPEGYNEPISPKKKRERGATKGALLSRAEEKNCGQKTRPRGGRNIPLLQTPGGV